MAVDEKAFDRLEWSYLYKVLEVYDFPVKCINVIKNNLQVTKGTSTNGILSEPFPSVEVQLKMPFITLPISISNRTFGTKH